jgi:hypothetical protein
MTRGRLSSVRRRSNLILSALPINRGVCRIAAMVAVCSAAPIAVQGQTVSAQAADVAQVIPEQLVAAENTPADGARPGLATAAFSFDSATLARYSAALPQPDPSPTASRHPGLRTFVKDLVYDFAALPSKENLIWASVGGGLALAVHPADEAVTRGLTGSEFARDFFKPGEILGATPTLLGVSGTIYLVGLFRDDSKISHIGMDLLEALTVNAAITESLKHLTHRERPDGSDNFSFPSGHASGTFAFATAFERHLGWKGAVPAYILASYVAMSRLPANAHWLSDVVFGSTVGIIAGRTVTRHGRPFPVTIQRVPGGVAILYVRE